MYTVENLEAMGSVYAQLTQLKGFNDPPGTMRYVPYEKYYNND